MMDHSITGIESATRLCELLLGLALAQQSIEHLFMPMSDRRLFALRLLLSLLLAAGLWPTPALGVLLLTSTWILARCDGPYNGGSDRVAVLMQICLLAVHLCRDLNAPLRWQEVAFGYLAIQIVLSYFMAGWVKIVNPQWRRGRALVDVFAFSAYPQSESLRGWAQWPRLLFVMSWAVIIFELVFPLALLRADTLIAALILAALFHTANALLFGLNRFVWVWLASYPSLLWLQWQVF